MLKGLGATGVVGLAGCVSSTDNVQTGNNDTTDTDDSDEQSSPDLADSMTAFHAGSLAPPFSEAEPQFEEEYGVDVTREAKGSVASTQKITQQGRSADILGVSDFRLIRDGIVPDYGNWYSIFTTNAMSIQYREDSTGAEDMSKENWWDVLSRDDVTIGHSDPAVDPGGYRAVMMLKLGAIKLNGERLYDEATRDKMLDNTIIPTGTETNLYGQLESGSKLDYVIYYRSISAQKDLPWTDLQQEVDLSMATSEYAQHYAKAEVETNSGTFTGAPIAYGMTVPNVATAPERGAQWVEFFASDAGQQILEDLGLVPVDPIVVPADSESAVPDRVLELAAAKQALGPLDL